MNSTIIGFRPDWAYSPGSRWGILPATFRERVKEQSAAAPHFQRMLQGMSQLIGNQPLSRARAKSKFTCTEYNIISDSVGMRIHIPRRYAPAPWRSRGRSAVPFPVAASAPTACWAGKGMVQLAGAASVCPAGCAARRWIRGGEVLRSECAGAAIIRSAIRSASCS